MDEVRAGLLAAGAACVVALPATGRVMVWTDYTKTAAVCGWASRRGLVLDHRSNHQPGETSLTFTVESRCD